MEEYIKINKQLMIQVIETMDKIEVKGYNNLNMLFGIMYTLRNELDKPKEEGGKNGSTKQ